jgi:hypothetical protein
LEELDCSAGANVRSRRNIIGKLKEIWLPSFVY